MGTLNYSTSIAPAKTIAEIQKMLVEHGADAVLTNYANGNATSLSFKLTGPHGVRAFTLPINVSGVEKVLAQQARAGEIRKSFATAEQAERVAWRVLKDWIAAQFAIIDAQMVSLDQVMLPYLHVDGERTLYESYRQNEQRALAAGKHPEWHDSGPEDGQ